MKIIVKSILILLLIVFSFKQDLYAIENCEIGYGDFNGDSFIDVSNDLLGWYVSFKGGYDSQADFNCDSSVNVKDLFEWYLGYKNRFDNLNSFSDEGRTWTDSEKADVRKLVDGSRIVFRRYIDDISLRKRLTWVLSDDINEDCGAPACYIDSESKIYILSTEVKKLITHEYAHSLFADYGFTTPVSEALAEFLSAETMANYEYIDNTSYKLIRQNKQIYEVMRYEDSRGIYYKGVEYELMKLCEADVDFIRKLLTESKKLSSYGLIHFSEMDNVIYLIGAEDTIDGIPGSRWLTDSLLIKIKPNSYNFNLLLLPIGIDYKLMVIENGEAPTESRKIRFKAFNGGEQLFFDETNVDVYDSKYGMSLLLMEDVDKSNWSHFTMDLIDSNNQVIHSETWILR